MGEVVLNFIGEILFQIAGEAFVEWLGWPRRAQPPPSEGELNASAAAIASIPTLIGAFFGGLCAVSIARGFQDEWLPVYLTLALIFGATGAMLSRWSLRVTMRRRTLATAALVTAVITLFVVVLAMIAWVIKQIIGA